jgi:hypothetical protein
MIKGTAAAAIGFPDLARFQRERRRHQRIKVSLLGRYMLADRREFPCQTIDMSPGGVALFAPVKAEVRERVIVYLDQIGRVEGIVARQLENGFALALNVTMMKREKLAEQLTWLANRHALGMPEDRRHERIVPAYTRAMVTMADGTVFSAKLIDVSLSGAAVKSDARVAMGMVVQIGGTQGRVVRIFDDGFAVEFSRLLPVDRFDDKIKL